MRGIRIQDVVGVLGIGACVWLYFASGWTAALGMFGAIWLVLMVVKIATTRPPAEGGVSGQPVRIAFTDYRPEWEKAAEVEARTELVDADDERDAHELVTLLRAGDRDRIREIGKRLDEGGGMRRMVRVCLRVKHLGGDATSLERLHWDGIGEWRA